MLAESISVFYLIQIFQNGYDLEFSKFDKDLQHSNGKNYIKDCISVDLQFLEASRWSEIKFRTIRGFSFNIFKICVDFIKQ
jgi:hypothetical protein